ncbi:MAG TPA: hypothetical protein VGB03_05255, partial [Acidimicrobiales bacterium]
GPVTRPGRDGRLATRLGADPAGPLLPPGTTALDAADYVSRMLLSFIGAQGRWDLTDRAQVEELVRTELVGGLRRL